MDWKLCITTFVTIFLAEFGDKTQLAAMAAASQSKRTFEITIAVVLALCLAGLIGVLAGKVVGQYLTPSFTKWASGLLFVFMGLWILIRP